MTGIRKKNKILGFIFAVLAVWMVIFQNPSYAAQRGSLNVKTEQAGMTVYLYRVAEKQAGVYVLNENFQASGADVSGGGSREAAIALTNFVKAQGIQPYRTGTGSGKHVVFRNLPDGEALYLVTGDPMTVGGKTYIPAPVLVEAGGAAAEADIKCDIEEPENPTNPTEPTNPTDPSNPTSPTRYYDDSDDDDWDPTEYTEQASAPTNVKITDNVITWDNSNYVLCWAVCKDGKVIAFTTEPTYTIEDTNATYSIRSANEMGGLGEAAIVTDPSAIDEVTTGLQVISTDYYNMQGIKVSASYQGVIIKIEKLENGEQVVTKVINK